MSTHGDGDPPDDARGFIEFLAGKRAPKLEQLQYSVLALGDSSYPRFCETGRLIDERLAALGARRLLDRVDCDLDYERLATPWLEQVVGEAREALGAPAVATVTRLRSVPAAPRVLARAAVCRAECSPISASPGATRPRTCVTSSCRSKARV